MKKILIIGKYGQVGSALARLSAERGFDGHAYSREELDILSPVHARQKIGEAQPDVVINTAAYHVLAECEANPERAFALNAAAVARLAGLCRARGITFVTYSTDYVFDGTAGRPYREDDEPGPLQVYGASKLAGERAALAAHPDGSFVIRTCGVYGGKEGSRSRGGNIVLTLLREARGKKILDAARDHIASPSFADDIARGTLDLLRVPDAAPGIYHIVNEGHCSWHEFARELMRAAALPTRIIPVERGETDGGVRRPLFSALENSRAKTLGVVLPSWQDGVQAYAAALAQSNPL